MRLLALERTIWVLRTLYPPPIRFGAEKDPIPETKVTMAEVISAGRITGSTASRKMRNFPAPRLTAASMAERSTYFNATETFR